MNFKNTLFLLFIFCFTLSNSWSQGAGNFVKYENKGTTLLVHGTLADLKIEAFTQDIFKVQVIKSNQTSFDSSYTVILKPSGTFQNVIEFANTIEAQFEKCSIIINKTPLKVALKANDQIKIGEEIGYNQKPDSMYVTFDINSNDVFHGGGAIPVKMDIKRRILQFYNTWVGIYFKDALGVENYSGLSPSYQCISIPFIVSSQKYGLLFDSNLPGQLTMDLGNADSTKLFAYARSQGQWAYYLINGDSNDEILNNYTKLTGKQPLPPRWALGFMQSKFSYQSDSDAMSTVQELQRENFPLDALILDIAWESYDGSFDWDPKAFQNSKTMIQSFKETGVKTFVHTDPTFELIPNDTIPKPNGAYRTDSTFLFAKFLNTNIPYTSYGISIYDIFKPKVQNWVWQKFKNLKNQGLEGIWSDEIEPTLFGINSLINEDSLSYESGNGFQLHNLYSFFWSKNIYENYRKEFPSTRVYNLARSAWTGCQRFSIQPWSGDVIRDWGGLQAQIPILLNSGMSGLALMGSDVGGFSAVGLAEKNDELDARWYQFATFSPMVRAHGWRVSTEAYNIGLPFRTIIKNHLNIRYQLLPYIYTLVWQNSTTGRPLSLPMDYFSDNGSGDLDDQYFFGEQLLVAPVMYPGMPQRQIYFPEGKWFDFWNINPPQIGTKFTNQDNLPFIPVKYDNIPVYAKAGSIIPMANNFYISSTDYYKSDSLNIKYFQDISVPKNTFTLYHDDGADANALVNQKYELIDLIGNTSTDSVSLSLNQKNTFTGNLVNRNITVEFENLTTFPKSISINNQNITIVYSSTTFVGNNIAFYNPLTKQLQVRFIWNCATPTKVVLLRDGLTVVTGNDFNHENNTLKVYPNPAAKNNKLMIEADINESGVYEIEIVNILGKSVMQATMGNYSKDETLKYTWNPENQSGIFMVNILKEKKPIMTKKIIIE